MNVRFVYMTTGNLEEAQKIGCELVSAGLAACVNILPRMNSIYVWEGKLEEASEVVMIPHRQGQVPAQLQLPLHREFEGGRRLSAVSGVGGRKR